ncbi:serine/threonine protein kinase [Pilimelia terevasa]|uniref:Serine/threonine protein kinase n=1 Tax=Pilimelia terevasa TaxID=53372 RepID=A0A8J3FHV2_9ACTN|nr:class III lanthionine synthetase LanKC [Pilimelia terevasa]GGK15957.1 serine/threonine protein kinase [Pilimelia terevasa]
MDDRYEVFCVADRLFFDALQGGDTSTGENAARGFAAADRPLPEGWRREVRADWLAFVPPRRRVPAQGWKIHASATPDNAERVLAAVLDHCLPRGIECKVLRSPRAHFLRSAKYAPRGHSGKLVTVYPEDEAECAAILDALVPALDGEPGPYILSDLRIGAGPLYVRYGGFAGRYCVTGNGDVVAAIEDDRGVLVPDPRDPVFRVPPWVAVPDFLAPHLAARNAVTTADTPYAIEQVIHFSNGGGLYRGRDTRTGAAVVLKEGRPYAGLDADGTDAATRVRIEHAFLTRLAGAPGVPEVRDLFTIGEHQFLAMEFLDGAALNKEVVARHPMVADGGPAARAAYTRWALSIVEQVDAAVAAMHDRGVVHGDLHLFNIFVRPDDSVRLLDFEVASLAADDARPGLGNQGFAPPPAVRGPDLDRYALACLRLAVFLPLTPLLWLAPGKAAHLAEIVAAQFPVPPDYLTDALATIDRLAGPAAPPQTRADGPTRWPAAGGWAATGGDLRRAITASASPRRSDRLFPGDVRQFEVGGLGLAHGAAGVLYALDVTGGARSPEHEQWLLTGARQAGNGTMIGMYDGLHGVAHVLDHLGHEQAARAVLDRCLDANWRSLGSDLYGGLAGIGLNLAHFADRTGDAALRAAARDAADLVAERLGPVEGVPQVSGGRHPHAGLLRGGAGAALLLLRACDDTGDPAYLDAAATALRQDLRRCRRDAGGDLVVDEGWRTMPYLAAGSVGIGLALGRYLDRRPDEEFAAAAAQIHGAALSPLYVQSGLFAGRAGIVYYLADRRRQLDGDAAREVDDAVAAQCAALGWHALPYRGGTAFPGEQLLRLSMDLATGTAGVLLAIGAAQHDRPVHLPLLATPARFLNAVP